MKLQESNVIFVKFYTRFQSKDFVVVHRPRLNTDFENEDEDEYEMYQISTLPFKMHKHIGILAIEFGSVFHPV